MPFEPFSGGMATVTGRTHLLANDNKLCNAKCMRGGTVADVPSNSRRPQEEGGSSASKQRIQCGGARMMDVRNLPGSVPV